MSFHVIKENEVFYLSTEDGLVPETGDNQFGYGLYVKDTRMLSEFVWTAVPACMRPIIADSSQDYESVYRYTNAPFDLEDGTRIQDQSVLVTRRQFVDGHGFYEQANLENFASVPLGFVFQYALNVDFADMFEVRGFASDLRPRDVSCRLTPGGRGAKFTYQAKDGIHCSTHIEPFGDEGVDTSVVIQDGFAVVTVTVTTPGHDRRMWGIRVTPSFCDALAETASQTSSVAVEAAGTPIAERVHQEKACVAKSYADWFAAAPTVSGNKPFQTWFERGLRDLRMLMTDIGYGEFSTAGVPWYAVPFGRDSIITSIQMMMANSAIAKGTLRTMAAFQGKNINPVRDEQPGKIMHELRAGELTRTGKVPFDPYYGTIDATPLFLNLATDYYEWTGDRDLIVELLPVAVAAFHWIEQYGDRDGDGFIEYLREAEGGISNQGWKDSGDSITHKDGSLAEGSIALCEVQGYVYRAYTKWQIILNEIGKPQLAREFGERADRLQARFVEAFWMESEGAVALALDGQKQQVQTISSNMGQVLWSGILPPSYANRLIDRLLKPDMDCGFGIRTLSSDEVAYNPISYHNGSVWPHDNSMIVAGMAHYGRADAVHRITAGLMRAGEGIALFRLPELFAGMSAGEVSSPVPYPVSCSPQAWAAATPIFILQSLLGLVPDVANRRVHLNPSLPGDIQVLVVEGIPIGQGRISLEMRRLASGQTATTVIENSTGLTVITSSVREVMARP